MTIQNTYFCSKVIDDQLVTDQQCSFRAPEARFDTGENGIANVPTKKTTDSAVDPWTGLTGVPNQWGLYVTTTTIPETDQDKARRLMDDAEQTARDVGIPVVLPIGATLDGVDAVGQTVTADYEPVDGVTNTDWMKFEVALSRRVLRTVEKFDVKEGRVEVPGTEIVAILEAVAESASLALERANDLEAMYRRGEYTAIITELEV